MATCHGTAARSPDTDTDANANELASRGDTAPRARPSIDPVINPTPHSDTDHLSLALPVHGAAGALNWSSVARARQARPSRPYMPLCTHKHAKRTRAALSAECLSPPPPPPKVARSLTHSLTHSLTRDAPARDDHDRDRDRDHEPHGLSERPSRVSRLADREPACTCHGSACAPDSERARQRQNGARRAKRRDKEDAEGLGRGRKSTRRPDADANITIRTTLPPPTARRSSLIAHRPSPRWPIRNPPTSRPAVSERRNDRTSASEDKQPPKSWHGVHVRVREPDARDRAPVPHTARGRGRGGAGRGDIEHPFAASLCN
ncbi:hypothetical protein C8Q78DRAFT_448852 [Trametes maxima]|nr:hypothetical protein C8Q78DRAFT_448852 [Trametes maxima]